LRRVLCATESAGEQQHKQYQKNESAKATSDCRTTEVKAASAEQKQKDDQHN
jgi:hypothetical protein